MKKKAQPSTINEEIAESLYHKEMIERFFRFGEIPNQKYNFLLAYLAS